MTRSDSSPLQLASRLEPAAGRRRLQSVRRYTIAGFLTMLALLVGIGGWAAATDLSGAVLAPGVVVVASNVKKIQHPTGGVVGEIFVENGDHVKRGDVLLKLDETVTRASLQLVTKQIDEISGRIARLIAERDDAGQVDFPALLTSRRSQHDVAQILHGEQKLFEQRVSTRTSHAGQLRERIAGIQEEISGTAAQVVAKSKEIDLIANELTSYEDLEAKKLITTSRMMALRREAARLEGERARLQSGIGQSKGRIAEIEIQRLSIDSEAKSEIIKELRESEGRLAELVEKRTAAEDQLKRVDVTSPVDGTVHQMTAFTVGGVINSIDPIMVIVPRDDKLVVEARIAPQDIDQARSHEAATIRFTSFNQRTTPTIDGRVSRISADLTHERETGQSYFVARIEISDADMAKLSGLELVPGMPAEVQIKTDARTALSYFVKPLEDQFAKAFRER